MTQKLNIDIRYSITKEGMPAGNSVYMAIAGDVVNRRSVHLINFVPNGQESAFNPLLHIHAKRYHTYNMTKVKLILFSIIFSLNALAQKENAMISLPESYVIYLGYDNLVKISFNKRRVRNISLECKSCELLKPLNNESNEWLLRVSKIEPVNIVVKNRRGKEIGHKRFVVLQPPPPVVHLDSMNAQSIIRRIPENIVLEVPSFVPLNAGYLVIKWTADVDGKKFEGRGRSITYELANHIKLTKTGTIIFTINFRSAFEENQIKEIFQYSLE